MAHFTPLRYPGGKGKLAPFIKRIVEDNDLIGCEYCEPYAGGAAIGIELLLQEYVSKIHINDISRPLHAFWFSILHQTDKVLRMLRDVPLTIKSWDKQKAIYSNPDEHTNLELGFATLFLNRTNRSGIFNAGVIGGRDQTGQWGIDARFNSSELARRIKAIAGYREKIQLTQEDAVEFLKRSLPTFSPKTLIYLDPPYYKKGKDLYYHYYEHKDHEKVAKLITRVKRQKWIVSYDNTKAIRDIYANSRGIAYGLNYSAREIKEGSEVMFFGDNLFVSEKTEGMHALVGGARPHRSIGFQPRAIERAVAGKVK